VTDNGKSGETPQPFSLTVTKGVSMNKFLIIFMFTISCFANPTVQIITRDSKISGEIKEIKQYELTLKTPDLLPSTINYADIDTISYNTSKCKLFITFPVTDSNINLFLKRCQQDIDSIAFSKINSKYETEKNKPIITNNYDDQTFKTNAEITRETSNKEIIHSLGTWHQTWGFVELAGGIASVIFGIINLAPNKTSTQTSGFILLASGIGGFSLGAWELSIGRNLKDFK
jgi:hypothetical protein